MTNHPAEDEDPPSALDSSVELPPEGLPAAEVRAQSSLILFALPMGMGILLAISTVALLIAGWLGTEAQGERRQIAFQSECPQSWERLLRERTQLIGLGDPVFNTEGDRVLLEATLPGLEDDLTAIPALLAEEGALRAYAVESIEQSTEGLESLITEADISELYLQLDLQGHPYVEVQLQPSATKILQQVLPPTIIRFELDGALIETYDASRPLPSSLLEFQPELELLEEEIRTATNWHLLLATGSAPCPVQVELLPPIGEAGAQ